MNPIRGPTRSTSLCGLLTSLPWLGNFSNSSIQRSPHGSVWTTLGGSATGGSVRGRDVKTAIPTKWHHSANVEHVYSMHVTTKCQRVPGSQRPEIRHRFLPASAGFFGRSSRSGGPAGVLPRFGRRRSSCDQQQRVGVQVCSVRFLSRTKKVVVDAERLVRYRGATTGGSPAIPIFAHAGKSDRASGPCVGGFVRL